MTEPLITVAQAAAHLRLDLETDGGSPETIIDARLPDVQMKMAQATDAVLDYLKIESTSPPKWTEETVPDRVRAAILLTLGSLYDDRDDGKLIAGLAGSDLSNPIVALLYRLRDPTLA